LNGTSYNGDQLAELMKANDVDSLETLYSLVDKYVTARLPSVSSVSDVHEENVELKAYPVDQDDQKLAEVEGIQRNDRFHPCLSTRSILSKGNHHRDVARLCRAVNVSLYGFLFLRVMLLHVWLSMLSLWIFIF
jgi:hypothetical protein